MARAVKTGSPRKLCLAAVTAGDMMTSNPVSIRAEATVREAVGLLVDKGFSAAPVIDAGGRPIGVLSRTDILIHDRETARHPRAAREEEPGEEPGPRETVPSGFQVEVPEGTLVGDLMTPAVFAVTPEAPAEEVIGDMLAYKVHRLFVVDPSGVLVGVITALDVLKHVHADGEAAK